jgi:hypothetical protein
VRIATTYNHQHPTLLGSESIGWTTGFRGIAILTHISHYYVASFLVKPSDRTKYLLTNIYLSGLIDKYGMKIAPLPAEDNNLICSIQFKFQCIAVAAQTSLN